MVQRVALPDSQKAEEPRVSAPGCGGHGDPIRDGRNHCAEVDEVEECIHGSHVDQLPCFEVQRAQRGEIVRRVNGQWTDRNNNFRANG